MIKSILTILPCALIYGSTQVEIPIPGKEALGSSINNYVFWAMTATLVISQLYIVTRLIPAERKDSNKVLEKIYESVASETESCRKEREEAAVSHMKERELDRLARHDLAARFQAAIVEVIKGAKEENIDIIVRMEKAFNRQTEDFTKVIDHQTSDFTKAINSQTSAMIQLRNPRRTNFRNDDGTKPSLPHQEPPAIEPPHS